MLIPLLFLLPWVGFAVLIAMRLRELPDPLPGDATLGGDAPLISVVVPARNEAANIIPCVESLVRSRYPAFEVVVVDDRSEDGTAELVRGVGVGNARRVEVVEGKPLPEGWLGKPWACWQGARVAEGDVLLFTDADTVHAPDLLARVVADLDRTGADAETVAGRQIVVSFWERVVMPQVFGLLLLRFAHRMREPLRPEQWRDAIANGQYLMFRRVTYEAVGGHEAVRGEVVEDLRMAQILVRGSHRLVVREAEDALATRMYRSLGEILEGWTKNIETGIRQTVPRGLRAVAGPVGALFLLLYWVVPPLVLVAGMVAVSLGTVGGAGVEAGASLLLWAGLATGVGAVIWGGGAWWMGISPLWGLFYPLGAAMTAFIVLRSWARGSRVVWKGRTYSVDPDADPGDGATPASGATSSR